MLNVSFIWFHFLNAITEIPDKKYKVSNIAKNNIAT